MGMCKGTSCIQAVTGSSGWTQRRVILFNSISLDFVSTSVFNPISIIVLVLYSSSSLYVS